MLWSRGFRVPRYYWDFVTTHSKFDTHSFPSRHVLSCLLCFAHPLSYQRVRDPRRQLRSPAGPRGFFPLGLLPRLAYPLPCSKNSMKWIGRKVAAGWWAPQSAAAGAEHIPS